MAECICGADEPCTIRCEKHDRDLHGYPCIECQREWREANPERAAAVDREVNRVLGKRRRTTPTSPVEGAS